MAIFNGTSGNDTLTGADQADILTGLAGNDTIYGNVGIDTLYGGDGNDSLFGGTEDDLLQGGAGNDFMDGGDGIDTLDYTGSTAAVLLNLSNGTAEGGHAVGDTFTGMENLIGSGFNDTLTGNLGANVIYGMVGNDILNGGLGADTMYGGAGADAFFIDDIGDVVSEASGGGIDTVNSSVSHILGADFEHLTLIGGQSIDGTGNSGNNTITGNSGSTSLTGDNLLQGLEGNDVLFGNGGMDTLDGGTGSDAMSGGIGSDLFIVDAVGDQVLEYINEGEDTVAASISYTLTDPLTSNYIEHVTLTGGANISAVGNNQNNKLFGNTGNNGLTGGAGNDSLRGEEGNDTLNGGTGNDTMIGGLGDDVYFVDHSQDDVIEGIGGGTDTVFTAINNYGLELNVENLVLGTGVLNGNGNNLDNVLTGNASDNLLEGESGDDTLSGGTGNDTLDGGTGADVMQGGAGNDVYKVDNIDDVASETDVGSGGTDRVETRVDHTMGVGIENFLVIGSGDAEGIGNELNNTMTGAAGDNLLNGMAGNDSLNGGDGDDTLIGGTGTDVFVGGSGNDSYVLDSALESITETLNDGIDTVQVAASYQLTSNLENLILEGFGDFFGIGNSSANKLTGNTGHNDLYGGDANDSLYGGTGNDLLHGGIGSDSMVGGVGDDYYEVDHIGDKVVETTSLGGNDTVAASIDYELGNYVEHLDLLGDADIDGTGNTLANILIGNSGNNMLKGDGGNDELYGNEGSDTLDGGYGADVMAGGTGNDTYIIDTANDSIVEEPGSGTDTVISSLSYTLAANFENLTLSATSGLSGTGNGVSNVINGNDGANLLAGLAGNDTLNGGKGADTLNGGSGADVMTGGAGNDTFMIDDAGDVVVEAENGGIDTIISVFNATVYDNFENLTLSGSDDTNGDGNAVANRISGNSGSNYLQGFAGNDTITGGGGADTINGGTGNDSMSGGLGNDVYFVDSSTDKIVEATTGGIDLVYATATYKMASGLEDLVMLGTDAINATGTSKANTIIGNSGANSINGGSGADTLFGGDGDDTLNGGSGNDSLDGGVGNDVYYVNAKADQITEGADAGIDTVMASTNWTLGDNVEHLIMQSTGAYRGIGNALDNEMTGNRGKNTLSGLAGDDTLEGGLGNDVLTGGEGADHFVFSTATAGNDTITDFTAVDGDLLVFSGLEVGTFVYLEDAAFTGGSNNSEARFDSVTGKFQIDTDGDGTANMVLTLTGFTSATQLDTSDFLWS